MLASDIPSDVFSLISRHLPLQSIGKLSLVCRRFWEYAHRDKRLWLDCLRWDVISRGIELPTYCQSLEQASAEDVRSWVKTAVTLHNAYASGGRHARVTSFVVDDGLETTWSKIIRGRWCLVALSNVSTSYLGIWQILSTGSMEFKGRFYFPGPVLDGVVDDLADYVRIAITVGTTEPYIEILSLGVEGEKIRLASLQRLERARHVLLLKGFLVGYKVLHGDDTYPLLTEWQTRATVTLHPTLYSHHPDKLMSTKHSQCYAMHVWRDYLFLVFNYSVEIFILPSFELPSSNPVYHGGYQSMWFRTTRIDRRGGWIGEACIYEANQVPDGIKLSTMRQSLYISVRNWGGRQYVQAIAQAQDGRFFWDDDSCTKPEFFKVLTCRHCVGASSGYQLRFTSEGSDYFYPLSLELTRHPLSLFKETEARLEARQRIVLKTVGLSMLDLVTTIDFDDAAGVILLGSCRGQISLVQFDESLQKKGGLLDDLPAVRRGSPDVPRTPISMDLPRCYYARENIHEGAVPIDVRDEAFERWDQSRYFPKFEPPAGWSSDWALSSSLQNWVLPFPRWRTLSVDQAYHNEETWNRLLRFDLGTSGDIVPIMYKEQNHHFVIFSIGQRIYYFLRGPPGDDLEHRILALPFSADDLSDPDKLSELWRRRWRKGPLCDGHRDNATTDRTEKCLKVLDFSKSASGRQKIVELSPSDDLRTWSKDDRFEMLKSALRHWEASHTPTNILQEERHDVDVDSDDTRQLHGYVPSG